VSSILATITPIYSDMGYVVEQFSPVVLVLGGLTLFSVIAFWLVGMVFPSPVETPKGGARVFSTSAAAKRHKAADRKSRPGKAPMSPYSYRFFGIPMWDDHAEARDLASARIAQGVKNQAAVDKIYAGLSSEPVNTFGHEMDRSPDELD